MIDRYSTEEMAQIWTDAHRFQLWFLIECAYLQSDLEFHKKPDADLLDRLKKGGEKIDFGVFAKRVHFFEEQVRHDVIAFLMALEEIFHEDARLIHLGLTSSDIVDTAFACQLKAACEQLETRLGKLILALFARAEKCRGVMCLGRTHGQAAEPYTFAIKLLSLAMELARGYERLKGAKEAISVGKLSGAIGIYAYSEPQIEFMTLKKLDLRPEMVSTQVVARDRHAFFFATLAIIAGSLERLAVELRLLAHGGVAEISEPFSKTQRGSSAMPHKKNPIYSENVTGLCRLIQSYAQTSLQNQALWHERDISHSSVERVIAPDATMALDFALKRMTMVVSEMPLHEETMKKNLQSAGDTIYSEGVLLALVQKGLMRQSAYGLVQKAALLARAEKRSLKEELHKDPEVMGHLSPKELNDLFDERHHVRHEPVFFARTEEYLKSLGIK